MPARPNWFVILEPMNDADWVDVVMLGPFEAQSHAAEWVAGWRVDPPGTHEDEWEVGEPTNGVYWATITQPTHPLDFSGKDKEFDLTCHCGPDPDDAKNCGIDCACECHDDKGR